MNLRFFYPKNRNCPCGSTRKAKSCCLISPGIWFKKPSNIVPKPPKTNYSNPKCYLNFSNDCCEKISREHYISEYVLNHVKHTDETIIITGLPWIKKDIFKKITPTNLSSKILCKRHNENSSGLDKQAGDMLRIITKINSEFARGNYISEIFVFSGIDLEKWMLKTVCNMVASDQIIPLSENINKPVLDIKWLKILYAQEPWPEGWGLYFMKETDEPIYYNQDFSFQPFYHPIKGEILGAKFKFNNFQFNFLLGKPDNPDEWGTFHPNTLIFKKNNIQKFIEITWNESNKNRYLEFNHVGTTDQLPPGYPSYPYKIE